MHPWTETADGVKGHPRSNRKTIYMPREHYKSTICSVAFPLWLLACVDWNHTIALISAVEASTTKWQLQIRQAIEFNDVFNWTFPEIVPDDPWNKSEATIKRDLGTDAQASISAYSIKSGLASQHHSYIILDDPVNEQVARSDADMATAVDLYIHLEEILKGWKDSGFLFPGTPWGREDVMFEARKEVQRGYRCLWGIGVTGDFEFKIGDEDLSENPEYSFMVPEPPSDRQGEEDMDGGLIFPEECNWDKLNHIRGQSEEKYSMQYLCKAYSPGGNGFFLERMGLFAELPDGTLSCECEAHRGHNHNMALGVTVVASDPAYTREKQGVCETSILVANRQPCDCRFLLEEWGGNLWPKDYVEKACKMAHERQSWLDAWGIEADALQLTLKQWLDEKRDNGSFPLKVQIIELSHSNQAKDARIAGAQPGVNVGKWHIKPTLQMVEGVNSTLFQLFQWPYSRKRDRADAFAYFEQMWKKVPIQMPDTSFERMAQRMAAVQEQDIIAHMEMD